MRPPARSLSLVLAFVVAVAAAAGPEDDRLKELDGKASLSKDEVSELVGLASRGDHRATDVGRRFEALRILSKHPVPAEVGDRLASRLAVTGGEVEDFVRVLVPGVIEASGTQNFMTHIALAKQINAGGPPQLMRASLKALEALGPSDPVVAELLAATALNPNHRIEVRRKALAVAGAMPVVPSKTTDSLEGTLFQAAKDPELRETAIAVLKKRPLSEEALAQLHHLSRSTGPEAAMANEVLKARTDAIPALSLASSGRFVDLASCKGYLENVADHVFRRVRLPPATAGARR